LLQLAKCWSAKNNVYGSIHYCLLALDINPNSPQALTWIAHGLWDIGKKDEAFKYYKIAASIKPTVSMHYFLGRKFEEDGKIIEALNQFNEAVKLSSSPGTNQKDKEMVLRIKEHVDTLALKIQNLKKHQKL